MGIGNMTPEEAAKLEADGAAQVAAQQEAAAAGNVDGNVEPCDTSDDGIRSRGGYMLNDSTWNPGGPWGGLPETEMDSEQNRRYAIVEMMKTATAFAFTHDFTSLDPFGTDLAGYFPASQAGRRNLESYDGDDRIEYAVQTGNDLATCKADPAFFVASIADAG